MIKNIPFGNDDVAARQKEFETGEGFKAGETVLESGLYNVFHDSRNPHQFGEKITDNLYKNDKFPGCQFCNPIYRILESKNYMD